LVRRSSGGGAILHDQELTYSLSLPTSHPLAADAETLYRETHGLLLSALADFGIAAELNRQTLVTLGGEPFLCFRRRSVGDVVVGNHKVCGSAQRRRKGAILQHGSILTAASAAAPELLGLRELGAPTLTVDRLATAWLDHWRKHLHGRKIELRSEAGTEIDLDAESIGRVVYDKYGNDSWTNRR
jgi:lipoate-protein ligase A